MSCYPAPAMLNLQDVTRKNWIACMKLSLHDHQSGYVAENVATIAESKFEPHHRLRAVVSDNTVVGMLAYCHETEPEDMELYWIFRLMIDRSHQGQGFGTEAIKMAINEITKLGGTRIRTMHKPENIVASAVYSKLGFRRIGALDDGDVLLELLPPPNETFT